MITACFDFGNSRCKVALFNEDEFVREHTFETGNLDEITSFLIAEQPDACILSSVIDHDPAVENAMKEGRRFHKLSAETTLNFTTPVGKPSEIGADRLALCAAAVHYFPGKNNLVIGLGTCITYNFINADSVFLGGSISPGMNMRFRAMHEQTALLPLAKPTWNYPLIGYNTITNLQCGVIEGMICEIDGLISRYAAKFGNFNAVLTGGDMGFFASGVKSQIFADRNFLYKGLYALSQTNCD